MKISEISTLKLEKGSSMLKAMAHPMRIAILNLLESGKKYTVTEIHEALDLEQSTTSHHLGILKDKTILASERKGKNTYYFLKNENLKNIINCVNNCTECD
jgi:DNA-binding transcriptional ArsR family regulator